MTIPVKKTTYTVNEVAEIVDKSVDTIRRHIKRGKLKVIRPGGENAHLRVPYENLIAYCEGSDLLKTKEKC